VVAGDYNGLGARRTHTPEKAKDRPFRCCGRCAAVENVTRDKKHVDIVVLDKAGDLIKNSLEFIQPIPTLPYPSGVPVAGMNDAH